MKNYIGKKIRGFSFKDGTDGILFNEKYMLNHIGKIGEIIFKHEESVSVKFENGTWYYPISLIEQYLVEEEPCIPQLGEGVLMEVSMHGEDWYKHYVVARTFEGRYVTNSSTWKYARPIQELPKYAHAELVEKLGHDFEYKQ
jgi:hypothetical protein